jgi:hypothetical protein
MGFDPRCDPTDKQNMTYEPSVFLKDMHVQKI